MMASRIESGPPRRTPQGWVTVLPLGRVTAELRAIGVDPADVTLRVQAIDRSGPVSVKGGGSWYRVDLGGGAGDDPKGNPAVILRTPTGDPSLRMRSQIQVSLQPPVLEPAEIIDPEGLPHHGDPDTVASWYPAGDEPLVREVEDRLRPLRDAVVRITGLEPTTPFGVVGVRSEAPTLVVPAPGIWPYRIDRDDVDRMLPILVHELVETTLHDRIRLREDPDNRWISDGLAEWTTFRALETTREWCALRWMTARHLRLVWNAGGPFTSNYDLSRFHWTRDVRGGDTETFGASILEEPAGYSLSLFFWIGFEEAYGAGAVREFLRRARDLPIADQEHLRALIDEIAGEPVSQTIRAMNLVKAYRWFGRWAERLGPLCRNRTIAATVIDAAPAPSP